MVNWLKNCVFYEVYPSSFYDSNGDGIGDINGITEKLPYIKELGCDGVWINPPFASAFKDGGYDILDYKKVAPRLGTNEDLYALFARAHELGMRVIIDSVPGHTSDRHPWFKASQKPQKNKYTNRYVWTDSVWTMPPDFKTVNGTTDRDGNYIVNWFSSQPALNYGFYEVKEPWQLPVTHKDCKATTEALIDVLEFWLSKGCDGFRVDMAGQMVKNDPECKGNIALWQSIFARIRPKYPEAVFVSEWFNADQALTAGFDMDFHFTGGYTSMTRGSHGEVDGVYLREDGRADNVWFLTDYEGIYSRTRDKGYVSLFTGNHDFVRLAGTCDSEKKAAIAAAVILTLPGVPYVYYGDEIGLKHNESLTSIEGGYYRTGCRTPMQWTDGTNAGFSSAPEKKLFLPIDRNLNPQSVASQKGVAGSMYEKYSELIALRKREPNLQSDGDFRIEYAKEGNAGFAYRRGDLLIAANGKQKAAKLPFCGAAEMVYTLYEPATVGGGEISLPPESFTVFRIQD